MAEFWLARREKRKKKVFFGTRWFYFYLYFFLSVDIRYPNFIAVSFVRCTQRQLEVTLAENNQLSAMEES